MGLAGGMPEYMLNEGRHAPLYFWEQRLYLRKPDGECFFVNPRYAHAHASTHHPAANAGPPPTRAHQKNKTLARCLSNMTELTTQLNQT